MRLVAVDDVVGGINPCKQGASKEIAVQAEIGSLASGERSGHVLKRTTRPRQRHGPNRKARRQRGAGPGSEDRATGNPARHPSGPNRARQREPATTNHCLQIVLAESLVTDPHECVVWQALGSRGCVGGGSHRGGTNNEEKDHRPSLPCLLPDWALDSDTPPLLPAETTEKDCEAVAPRPVRSGITAARKAAPSVIPDASPPTPASIHLRNSPVWLMTSPGRAAIRCVIRDSAPLPCFVRGASLVYLANPGAPTCVVFG